MNDAPVLTVPASVTTPPNTGVSLSGTATDPDAGAGLIQLEVEVSAIVGPVTADGTFTWSGGTDVTSDTLIGTLAEVNAALASIVFTPGAGQVGIARVDFDLDDQGNTGTGGAKSDTAFTLITVVAPGDPLTIEVPDDIVVDAPLGEPGVAVTFAAPVVTGGVPPITVACDYASGDIFPIGVTVVTCTAEDSDDADFELFALVSDSFTITVNEAEAPVGPEDPGSPAGPDTPGAGLPATGVDPSLALWLALSMLLTGAAALRVARRRATGRV